MFVTKTKNEASRPHQCLVCEFKYCTSVLGFIMVIYLCFISCSDTQSVCEYVNCDIFDADMINDAVHHVHVVIVKLAGPPQITILQLDDVVNVVYKVTDCGWFPDSGQF